MHNLDTKIMNDARVKQGTVGNGSQWEGEGEKRG
jgi:hypothetical protein